MVIVIFAKVPPGISKTIFYTLHPAHVILSAIVTAAMYKKYGRGKVWAVILVGYAGSIGIGTISDALVPYLGGTLLNLDIEFEIPFIEEWWLINPAALIGIAIGYLRPTTKFPHYGHVLLSTWASLFYFTTFGIAPGIVHWISLLPFIFLFLFLAVWIPCCISDIVFPLLFTGKANHHKDST